MSETETVMRAARTILNFRGGTMSSAVELAQDLQEAGVITPEGLRWQYAAEWSDGSLANLEDTSVSGEEIFWTRNRKEAQDAAVELGCSLIRRIVGPVEVVVG